MDQDNTATIDPLAMPAGELEEPKFPVLREGVYRMVIAVFDQAQSEKDGKTTDRINVKLRTTTDALDTEGKPLHKGFMFNVAIFLTPNEKTTMKQIAETAAMPIKAVLGATTKTSVRDVLNNPSLILEKPVDVKIGVRKAKEGTDFGDSNSVKAWVIPQ